MTCGRPRLSAMARTKADFLAELKKRLPRTTYRRASDKAARGEVTDVCRSGLDVLDHYVIGCGGYPCRRLTEIVAEEGIGKSSLLFAAFAAAQEDGYNTHYIETENRLNRERVAQFGVDLDRLGLDEPPWLEKLLTNLEVVLDAAKLSKTPTLVGWDSIAACPTEAEVKQGLTGKQAVAERARVLSQAIRVASEKVASSNVALVCVNQLRTNIGVAFGDNQRSVGGNALAYFGSVRLRLMGGTSIKRGAYHIGKAPVILGYKNLFAPPFRKARIFLVYDEGWSNDRTMIEFANDVGVFDEDARMSAANVERAHLVLDQAEWRPERVPEVLAKLEEIDDEKSEAKPAKKATKKTAKRKSTKKKTAKKKTAKKAGSK